MGDPVQTINIPADWAAFFIVMLLSPAHFDWAKKFLSSQTWNFMIGCSNSDSFLSFALPASCPENAEVRCQNRIESEIADVDDEPEISPLPVSSDCHTNGVISSEFGMSAMETGKGKGKAIIPHVETEARRSPRIRARNNGFKHNSCSGKNCLACACLPPTLSKQVIRSIGEDFCKISARKLSDEELVGKKRGKQAIGERKTSKADHKSKNQEGKDGQDQVKKPKI
jgi:hypothetical protein